MGGGGGGAALAAENWTHKNERKMEFGTKKRVQAAEVGYF